jgi:polyisoprenoid-binding protein YceI
MRRSTHRTPAAIVLGLLAAAIPARPAAASELILKLDPTQTRIDFTLSATLHQVEGTLALTSGEIRFDPATGAASGRVVVDAKSAQTGSAGRDRTMHDEVLESARYPQIVFEPERLAGTFDRPGASRITLSGTVEVHGARHPVVLPAEVEVGPGGALTGTATFEVPFVEWGMKDPGNFLLRVAKKVTVTVRLSGAVGP